MVYVLGREPTEGWKKGVIDMYVRGPDYGGRYYTFATSLVVGLTAPVSILYGDNEGSHFSKATDAAATSPGLTHTPRTLCTKWQYRFHPLLHAI